MTGLALEEILNRVTQITQNIVSKESEQIDKEAKWPEKNIRALQKAGLGGLVISKEHGGLGHGLVALAKVCEILGAHCPSTALCFGMHCVGSAVISAKATENQRQLFLEPIIKGEHLTTLALSEPGTGAHFYFPQTGLQQYGENKYLVNGKKTFVTNGGFADSYVLSTLAVEADAPSHQFSCIVLENSTKGLEWGEPWNGLGMRGNASKSLTLNSVVIPSVNLLGERGDQLWYIFHVVAPYFLTAMSGTYLGVAKAAFNEACDHLKQRSHTHSGKSLGEISLLQYKLGTLWAKVERTRRLLYHACEEADIGKPESIFSVLSSKAEVANTAVEVVNEAMTLTGGIGYRENARLGRLLRDARAAHVMSPTTDLLYTWLGRAILDLPILAD